MNEYRIKAYAKINLGLDVVRRLENGYHEVKMVMQTVGIYDVLDFERTDGGIVITTDSGELPTDENNLIYKAAKLMMETYPISGGVKIHLEKHIPIAAGMAGGSTDAAATLKGMNRLFDLGCTLKDLMELGVKIGADVPYCVMGGTALAEGSENSDYYIEFAYYLHLLYLSSRSAIILSYASFVSRFSFSSFLHKTFATKLPLQFALAKSIISLTSFSFLQNGDFNSSKAASRASGDSCFNASKM